MLFVHELYSVGISFRICLSLSNVVEKMEPEVEDLARRIVDNLDIDISSPNGDA